MEVSRQLKKVYKEIADRYGTEFLEASDYAEPSSADREHLSAEGHRALAGAVYSSVLRIMSDHLPGNDKPDHFNKNRNLSDPAPAC